MYKNNEGYNDTTAGKALANIELGEKNNLIKYIKKYALDRGYIVDCMRLKKI